MGESATRGPWRAGATGAPRSSASGARGRRRRRGCGGLRPRRPAAAAGVGALEEARVTARARARADARAHAHLAALRRVELALAHLLARAHQLDAVAPALLWPGAGPGLREIGLELAPLQVVGAVLGDDRLSDVAVRVLVRVRVRVRVRLWLGLGRGLGLGLPASRSAARTAAWG